MITYVIPCGADKEDHPAPARDLYTGAMFRHTLTAALAAVDAHHQDGETAQVLILSARYGLVHLDEVLTPYEQRMDRSGRVAADTITVQAWMFGLDEVYAFLPRAYHDALSAALRPLCVYPLDAYEDTAGIGEQRHVNAVITTTP